MATSQTERNQKYKEKFTRPDVKILKSEYVTFKNFVLQKGYTGINDYVNTVLAYDFKNNIIPDKKDIIPDNEIKEE